MLRSVLRARAIGNPEKPLLNLRRNLGKPLLGAFCPPVEVAHVGLKVLNAVFGGLQLKGKFLGDVQGVPAVLFSHASGLMEQTQNALPGNIQ